ncbi:hypothetical protein GOB83_03130 [Acetobacter fabarum]|jgi:uncharacterized protein YidB (DUF937 family)|uniref:hypothetical protein n=1 Tax=Acetobacter TaxID=434 RepID=UPI000A3744C8|nr:MULTISPECIES: hypothetical protein [Acetobacter]MDN6714273.1 hypothetical protein [Acetobacter sp.]MCH4025872.1 hypothetical protein [Acetobacter fabarum]MCH4086268.1 hypothetical protein [Acetobacter fabarum]MCH4128904.1 hypothetical protein [Acetobacter fabarum]MCH4138143.1 hypothetical protein [Acetobacter fabarum]
MTFLNTVSNAITHVGDFITGATGDKSGLMTALNEVLGPVPRPDLPSKLEKRAQAMGMISTIRRWQSAPHSPPATEAEVRGFFLQEELDWFSEQTGLSDLATMKMIRKMLPQCVRLRAIHDPSLFPQPPTVRE